MSGSRHSGVGTQDISVYLMEFTFLLGSADGKEKERAGLGVGKFRGSQIEILFYFTNFFF